MVFIWPCNSGLALHFLLGARKFIGVCPTSQLAFCGPAKRNLIVSLMVPYGGVPSLHTTSVQIRNLAGIANIKSDLLPLFLGLMHYLMYNLSST